MTWHRARLRHLSIVWLLLVCLAGVRIDAQSAGGAEVKAAFLFNFAKFVIWPVETLPAGTPIVVGVIGNDAIAASLTSLTAGKMVDGHALQIKRVGSTDDPAACQLLFVDNSERARVAEVLRKVGKANVLTISDAPRFLASGGVIQLRTEDDRVRFDVDLQHAKDAALVINSKLLSLAGTVNPVKTH